MVSYFAISNISLIGVHWLYKRGIHRTWKYGKLLMGVIVAHYLLVFMPAWAKLVRWRNLYEQAVDKLTL